MDFIQNIDDRILYYIEENLHGGFLDNFFYVINFFMYSAWIWIAAAVVMLFSKKWRHTGIILLITLAVTSIISNFVLKELLFTRTRPFNADPSINVLIPVPLGEYSFPSSHSLVSAACATVIFIRSKYAGIAAIVFALLVGFSRIFFAVHYFSDVLAGLAFGTLMAVIIYALLNKPVHNIICKDKTKLSDDS